MYNENDGSLGINPNLSIERRLKKGISALQDVYTLCVGAVRRRELDFKKYPLRNGHNPCNHLECTRVTTKIIHPVDPVYGGDISLVSN